MKAKKLTSDETFFNVKKSNGTRKKITYINGSLKTLKLSELKIHPLNKGIYGINNQLIQSLWKIRSLRAPHSGSTEQSVPEMIEHHKPKCKQHNISTNL